MNPARLRAVRRGPDGPSLSDLISRWMRLTPVALALVAIALSALLAMNDVHNGREEEAVTATRLARTSHEAMLDQANGFTAFAVTGEERYRNRAVEASDRLAATRPELERLLPRIAPALTLDMRVAQQAWLDRWVPAALAAGEDGGAEGPAAGELLADGTALLDRYRAAHDALIAELLVHRDQAISGQTDAVARTATLGLVVTAAMTAAAMWRGRRLRRIIAPALDGILDDLARIQARDFEPTPTRGGPAELAAIERGVADTADALRGTVAQVEAHAERLAAHNRNLGQVLRLSREVAGSLNLGYVVKGVCSAAHAISDARTVVWLRADGANELVARADSAGVGMEAFGLEPVLLGDGAVGRAARFARTDGHRHLGLEEAVDGAGDALAVPMVVGAEVVGVIELRGAGPVQLPRDTVDVLEALAVQAASAIGAARVHEHTEVLATTDALTGLPNRRRLEGELATEVAVASRHGRPLGFAMLDVDHFKAYNDEFGHQAGDVALQALAHLLAGSARAGDTVYRYGGEELAVIMRETDTEGAQAYAERLCRLVEHHFNAPAQLRAVTVSIGVASIPADASSPELLVASADAALYEAKHRCRKRVVASGGIIAGRTEDAGR